MKNPIIKPPQSTVSEDAANAYQAKTKEMLKYVNQYMLNINTEKNLIGQNTISTMNINHKNHAQFMNTVFQSNDYNLLFNTLKWVFSSYEARGFKTEYFPTVLNAWIEAVNLNITNQDHTTQLINIYQWIIDNQKSIEKIIQSENLKIEYPYSKKWEEKKNHFANFLLMGNGKQSLEYAKEIVDQGASIEDLYLKVITYAMYEVGLQWQNGEISTAQEHLATSIVSRIISLIYLEQSFQLQEKGNIIVSSSMNELHELGARIIADFLELDGWDVTYLGANTPNDALLQSITQIKPKFIVLSVTMSYNIEHIKALIEQIRTNQKIAHTKIIIGGYAFSFDNNPKNKLNADLITSDPYQLLEYINKENDAK